MPFIKLSLSDEQYARIVEAAGEVPLAKWAKLRLREALDEKLCQVPVDRAAAVPSRRRRAKLKP